MIYIFTFFIVGFLNLPQDNIMTHPLEKLKSGALLVRLQTNEKLINHHLEMGNIKKANTELRKQKERNQNIIKAFQKEWKIGPVYFFYSNHYDEIKENQFQNVFTNEQELKLNNLQKQKLYNNFLIAYFGKKKNTPIKFHALTICDANLTSLKKPIPSYVRTYKGLGIFERKLENIVNIIQKKIEFYQSRIQ